MMNKTVYLPLGLLLLSGLFGCGSSSEVSVGANSIGATPRASCGPGSLPETGMQGRVTQADHDSGRAAQGYTCNAVRVGEYTVPNAIGTVGGFKVEKYVDSSGRTCAYYDSTLLFPTNVLDANAGVNVLDMSDPTNPVLTSRLVTPAMLSPHESVVVSQQAGVLAAVTGNPAAYPGLVDVYDLEPDCRTPTLRSSAIPSGFVGHESGLSPDGKTFYSASPGTPTLTAVDITTPLVSAPVWSGNYTSHGLSISNDGNRAYLSQGNGNGVLILDVSEIQARLPNPQVREVGAVSWPSQTIPQNAIPFTRNGHPYLMEIDEFSGESNGGLLPVAPHGTLVGAGRIIDINDETNPVVISNLRLEVHEPENRVAIANDPGAQNPTGGYAGHYCNIPSRVNPDIVACSMILSGLRVFDIRDPHNPREIAYYNAPIQPRIIGLPGPAPVPVASNWAMSSPSFVPERKEIWYTDGYSGFHVVRLTNGVW